MRSYLQSALLHLRNAGWVSVDLIASTALLFVVTPILLNRLGVEEFSYWALACSIPAVGQLMSLGMGTVVTTRVAEEFSQKNSTKVAETVVAALSIVAALCGAVAIVLCTGGGLLASFLFESMGPAATVGRILGLGAVLLLVGECDNVVSGALKGMARFDLVGKIDLVARFIWATAISAVAYLTASAESTILASIVVLALKLALKVKALLNALNNGPVEFTPKREIVRALLNHGKWVSMQGLGGALFAFGDRILVGALLGPQVLARYVVCSQLAQLSHSLQATALQIIVPYVGSRKATMSSATLMRLAFLGGLACLILPLSVAFFTPQLLQLWIGKEFADENTDLCRLLILAFGLLSATISAHYILLSFSRHRVVAITLLVGAILSITVSVALATLGVEAFALGKCFFGLTTFVYFYLIPFNNERTAKNHRCHCNV